MAQPSLHTDMRSPSAIELRATHLMKKHKWNVHAMIITSHHIIELTCTKHGLPQWASPLEKLSANAGDIREVSSIPGLGRLPGEGNDNPLQYSCLDKSHGQRSLVGYSPQGHKELDTTEVTWPHEQSIIQNSLH